MNPILASITEAIKKGDRKTATAQTQAAIDAQVKPDEILSALVAGMDDVGRRFKNNEIYVPEVLIAARSMKESMALLKPLLIVYRAAWPTYFLGRALVKLPYIGLVNVIAGRKVMPEFIQRDASPGRIAAAALAWLGDGAAYGAAVEALREVRAAVGAAGASGRAAGAVLAAVSGNRGNGAA